MGLNLFNDSDVGVKGAMNLLVCIRVNVSRLDPVTNTSPNGHPMTEIYRKSFN